MIGIYKITSPSGRIYVGQSINVERRLKGYSTLGSCNDQPKLYYSFVKYGFSKHIFEVVEECSEDQLNVRERHWQDFYDVLSEGGLNCKLTKTEDKSGRLSEETKKKITELAKGRVQTEEAKKANSLAQLGKKLSEETKRKIGDSLRGNIRGPHSEEAKRKIGEARKGIRMSEEDIARRQESRRKNAELKGKKY